MLESCITHPVSASDSPATYLIFLFQWICFLGLNISRGILQYFSKLKSSFSSHAWKREMGFSHRESMLLMIFGDPNKIRMWAGRGRPAPCIHYMLDKQATGDPSGWSLSVRSQPLALCDPVCGG